jgi:heme oxygenase (biliverdin-IX-beta and delta-forming)
LAVVAPVSLPAPDALDAVREATRARHAYVDTHMPLAQAAAGLRHYREHLALLAQWLAPLQQQLAAQPGPLLRYATVMQRRLAQMHADLAATGASPAPQDAAPALPPQAAAFWWGVAYVIEGSQLGAAVLHRQLSATLAPFEPAYLGGAAQGPGGAWRTFLADLREHVSGAQPVAQCCRGACWAFDRLIALLPREHAA